MSGDHGHGHELGGGHGGHGHEESHGHVDNHGKENKLPALHGKLEAFLMELPENPIKSALAVEALEGTVEALPKSATIVAKTLWGGFKGMLKSFLP